MNSEEITAWIKSFREALDDETATVKQRLAQLNAYGQALDIIEALEAQVASLNEKLTKRDEEVDSLTQQLQEERNLRLTIEMRFKEMSKLADLVFQAKEITNKIKEEKYNQTRKSLEDDCSNIQKELH